VIVGLGRNLAHCSGSLLDKTALPVSAPGSTNLPRQHASVCIHQS